MSDEELAYLEGAAAVDDLLDAVRRLAAEVRRLQRELYDAIYEAEDRKAEAARLGRLNDHYRDVAKSATEG